MKYQAEIIRDWAGDSQWRAWRADLARYHLAGFSGWGSEGFWVVTIYRLQRAALLARPRWFWLLPRLVLACVRKVLTLLTHISLPPQAKLGPGLLIPHVGPIQLNREVVIGADCTLMHVVTIGAGGKRGAPVLGDHVFVGCHSCVLGGVQVGDRADIGAGAVVVCDVPADARALGVPAKIFMKTPQADESVVNP